MEGLGVNKRRDNMMHTIGIGVPSRYQKTRRIMAATRGGDTLVMEGANDDGFQGELSHFVVHCEDQTKHGPLLVGPRVLVETVGHSAEVLTARTAHSEAPRHFSSELFSPMWKGCLVVT